jgi:thermitase
MKRSISTPIRANAAPICEGFIIGVGGINIEPEEAYKLAVNAVNESIRGDWVVNPLGKESRDFEVRKQSQQQRIKMQSAWEFTKKLEQHRDIYSAEPELIVPGIDPDPSQVFTRGELSRRSFVSKKNLPCTEEHQWSLDLSFISEAWELDVPDPGTGKQYGEGVVIGHPDTGFTDHPEILDAVRLLIDQGYDFESDDSVPRDSMSGKNPGHGTSTASVIMSAIGPEHQPPFVSGAAPQARLVPLRVSTSVVHLSFGNLTKAIYFAADNGHHVISMSLGGPFRSRYLHRAILYAIERGVILLAAAGNVWPWVVYPAKFDEVIAVAACNCNKEIWSDSAAGPTVDVTAPGESVWRAQTRKGSKFDTNRSSGTSYAVATAAGVCALWLAFHGRDRLINRFGKENLASVFKELLITAGVDTPGDWDQNNHGAGILNAEKLLQADLPATPRAAGMKSIHAGRSPQVRTDLPEIDEFMDFFPGLGLDRVQSSLLRLLRIDAGELQPIMSELGAELLFHIVTNPEVRTAIFKEASGQISRSKVAEPVLLKNTRFRKNASRLLIQHLFE